ncbi:hypothetical protein [Romboutsia sp.]|uniref:hypothetical protein n=1 Tax=Romboutsia sp. TaxID=1965302 RepID=UPI003F2C10BA
MVLLNFNKLWCYFAEKTQVGLQVDGNPIGVTPTSINVGTVPAGGTSVVTFKVKINC